MTAGKRRLRPLLWVALACLAHEVLASLAAARDPVALLAQWRPLPVVALWGLLLLVRLFLYFVAPMWLILWLTRASAPLIKRAGSENMMK